MKPGTAITLSAAILALASCTSGAPTSGEAIDSQYTVGGGTWSTGGGITVAVRVSERNGVTVVCGAWATDRQSTQSIEFNGWVIEAGAVDIAGDRVAHNLSFMRRVPYSSDITGEQAGCIASTSPWKPEYATTQPVPRLPRMAFQPDDIDDTNAVIFKPGPRDDIVR